MSEYIKTVTGQIEHLKELGLIIPDEKKAFEILSDIGFYRLGFYMFPFEKMYPNKAGRRIRNRCAHGGVLYDYVASKRLVAKGPIKLSNVYDRFNLNGAIRVVSYLVSVISSNRKDQLEQELQGLIIRSKDDEDLYKAISIASGL